MPEGAASCGRGSVGPGPAISGRASAGVPRLATVAPMNVRLDARFDTGRCFMRGIVPPLAADFIRGGGGIHLALVGFSNV